MKKKQQQTNKKTKKKKKKNKKKNEFVENKVISHNYCKMVTIGKNHEANAK